MEDGFKLCLYKYQKFNLLLLRSSMQSINMFPYSQFLRMDGKEELGHKCGGISSIVIVCLMVVLMGFKVAEAIRMETVFFFTESSVRLDPPMTTLSTFMNDTEHQPFMIAIQKGQDANCPTQDFATQVELQIEQGTYLDPNRKYINEIIQLERCTFDHFGVLPAMKERSATLRISDWLCLPLNRTFQIGGSQYFSSSLKRLRIMSNCTSSCDGIHCGSLHMYQIQSLVNPNNKDHPFEYYLSGDILNINNQSFYWYAKSIAEEVIVTDTSLLPTQSIVNQTGLSMNQIVLQSSSMKTTNETPYTSVFIQRSSRTNTIQRSYLKFLDVLSYVGGLYPTLVSLFFIVSSISSYFYQISFAKLYFRDVMAKENGITSFIKESFYRSLADFGYNPDWKNARRQCQLRDTVNKVLDIVCICSRIEFLERAITLILDKHQLKGIYLMRNPTLQQTEQNFRFHRYKDRVVTYLSRKAQRSGAQSYGQIKLKKKEVPEKKQINEDLNRPGSVNTLFDQYTHKYKDMDSMPPAQKKYKNTENQQISAESQGTEYQVIDDVSESQLQVEELQEDLKGDLKKLVEEGSRRDGNQMSKKILKGMNGWLTRQIQKFIKEDSQRLFSWKNLGDQ